MPEYVKRGRPKKSVVRPKITQMSELINIEKTQRRNN